MATTLSKNQINASVFYADSVSINNTDSPYTLLSETDTARVDVSTAAVTILLPAVTSSNAGRRITIKDNTGSASINNITINADGTDTIDGNSTEIILTDRASLTIESDGISEWAIIERN